MKVFEKTVSPLLKKLGLEAAPNPDNHYVLELDNGLQMHLIGNWQDNLIMVMNLGVTDLKDAEQLWRLLEENLFCEFPHIQISASADEKKIILWTQERLSQLDSSSLIALFERLIRRAEEILERVNGKAEGLPKASKRMEVATRLNSNSWS